MRHVDATLLQSDGTNVIVGGFVIGLLLGPLVYVHAENRGRNGLAWGLVCFLFGPVGLIVYGIVTVADSWGSDGSSDGVRSVDG